jgi:hypothetical protein
LRCGHIYSASVIKQVYIGPDLKQKLTAMCCVDCGAALTETVAPYPEQYLSSDGVMNYQRPTEIPLDEESVVVDFDEIYS